MLRLLDRLMRLQIIAAQKTTTPMSAHAGAKIAIQSKAFTQPTGLILVRISLNQHKTRPVERHWIFFSNSRLCTPEGIRDSHL